MVMSRSAPASCTLASNPFLTAARSPYRRNAIAMDARVNSVRNRLRRRFARIIGTKRSITLRIRYSIRRRLRFARGPGLVDDEGVNRARVGLAQHVVPPTHALAAVGAFEHDAVEVLVRSGRHSPQIG